MRFHDLFCKICDIGSWRWWKYRIRSQQWMCCQLGSKWFPNSWDLWMSSFENVKMILFSPGCPHHWFRHAVTIVADDADRFCYPTKRSAFFVFWQHIICFPNRIYQKDACIEHNGKGNIRNYPFSLLLSETMVYFLLTREWVSLSLVPLMSTISLVHKLKVWKVFYKIDFSRCMNVRGRSLRLTRLKT